MRDKMVKLEYEFNEFCKEIYGTDPEKFLDYSEYYFDCYSWIEIEEAEIKKAFGIKTVTDDLMDLIEDVALMAKSELYEQAFMSEVYEKAVKMLTDKIHEDFEDYHELIIPAFTHDKVKTDHLPLLDIDIDLNNNKLIIEGHEDLLDEMILCAVNGHGMFHWDNIYQFRRAYGGDAPEERIKGHMHWLKHIPDIYGTRHFKLSFEGIDRYLYPDFDLTKDVIFEYANYYFNDIKYVREFKAEVEEEIEKCLLVTA
jgi:hypothetical protein